MSLPATPVSYAACRTAACRMRACEAANDAFRGETVYALRKQVTRGILCDTPMTYAPQRASAGLQTSRSPAGFGATHARAPRLGQAVRHRAALRARVLAQAGPRPPQPRRRAPPLQVSSCGPVLFE
jgi:hypothetical protein